MDQWEDKYHRLRTERDELAKKYNEQGDCLRQIRTKFAKLESLWKQKATTSSITGTSSTGNDNRGIISSQQQRRRPPPPPSKSPPASASSSRRRNKENESFYDDLSQRYNKLQRDYRLLSSKHEKSSMAVAKYKKETQVLKRRLNGHLQSRQHLQQFNKLYKLPTKVEQQRGESNNASKEQQKPSSIRRPSTTTATQQELERRLSDSESRIISLQNENEMLRSSHHHVHHPPPPPPNDDTTIPPSRHHQPSSSSSSSSQVSSLAHDLKNANAKILLLQTRHDYLLAQNNTQSQLQSQSLSKLATSNDTIRRLRVELLRKTRDFDATTHELRNVEERLRRERSMWNEETEGEMRERRLMMENEERDRREWEGRVLERMEREWEGRRERWERERGELKEMLDGMRREGEELRVRVDDYERKEREEEEQQAAAALVMRRERSTATMTTASDGNNGLFDDVDPDDLQRALAIVKGRPFHQNKNHDNDDDDDDDDSLSSGGGESFGIFE